jgi:hypothetical protein
VRSRLLFPSALFRSSLLIPSTRHAIWNKSPLVDTVEPFTDKGGYLPPFLSPSDLHDFAPADWLDIKADVLKMVEEIKAVQETEAGIREEERRKERAWDELVRKRRQGVESRYSQLRQAQPDVFSRAAFPLKADFFLFESVKALELPGKIVEDFDEEAAELADEIWDDAVPLIQEELDQYRLDVVFHAIKSILAVTTEQDVPDDNEILDNIDRYNDAFFASATSFLCCNFRGCHRKNRRLTWYYGGSPGRDLFVGPLIDLLEHQHQEHSEFKYWYNENKKEEPQLHFDLPLEVACAVSALVDLGDLDDDATKSDLDELDKKARWEWENAHCKKKHYEGWRGLVRRAFPLVLFPFPPSA